MDSPHMRVRRASWLAWRSRIGQEAFGQRNPKRASYLIDARHLLSLLQDVIEARDDFVAVQLALFVAIVRIIPQVHVLDEVLSSLLPKLLRISLAGLQPLAAVDLGVAANVLGLDSTLTMWCTPPCRA